MSVLAVIAAVLLAPVEPPTGWTSGTPRIFAGSALYDHINGGAELFLELGFDKVTIQQFHRDAGRIDVEIYEMKDTNAAFGLYRMKCGQEERHPDLKDRHTLTRHQLMLQRNRFFVLVHNLGGHKELLDELVRFGDLLAARMPEDQVPEVLSLLPDKGRVPGSERIIRGPFSLAAVATLGEGDVLLLGDKVTAVAADYRGGPVGDHARLVAAYASEDQARRAFAHLVGHLDPHLKVLRRDENLVTFRDHADRMGDAAVAGARITVRTGMRK